MEYEPVDESDLAPSNGEKPGDEIPRWQAILDAPDYISLLKGKPTAQAQEYQTRVNSVLKEVLKYRLGSGTPSSLADVSALLAYGPDFAERAGALADHDERARKALDILTAPDNPWIMFAFAAIPLIGQFLRNHDEQIKAIPGAVKKTRAERKAERANRPKPVIHLGKRVITLPIRVRIRFALFRPNSVEPQALINHVMASEKVRKALKEQYGVTIRVTSND